MTRQSPSTELKLNIESTHYVPKYVIFQQNNMNWDQMAAMTAIQTNMMVGLLLSMGIRFLTSRDI